MLDNCSTMVLRAITDAQRKTQQNGVRDMHPATTLHPSNKCRLHTPAANAPPHQIAEALRDLEEVVPAKHQQLQHSTVLLPTHRVITHTVECSLGG